MKKLENELEQLRLQVVEMGNLTEKMLNQAMDAINNSDNQQIVANVIAEEEKVDQMQVHIDKEAVRILTVYSPVAGDLRLVLTVSRITAELERIGDHAVNMCESLQLMNDAQGQFLPEISKMANVVSEMVGNALNAFMHNDSEKAQVTIANDNLVDALNDKVIEKLLNVQTVRQALTGPKDVAGALAQMVISRSLERIADQATNIGEEVVYMVKGDDIRHSD